MLSLLCWHTDEVSKAFDALEMQSHSQPMISVLATKGLCP